MIVHPDSFSSGQVGSKIWCAEELESACQYYESQKKITAPYRILMLGGWYGVLNLILRSRDNIKIDRVRSLDIDEEVCNIADLVNNYWVWQQWQFKSVHGDANTYQYGSEDFNIIINTATEHMESRDWFNNIPKGSLVVLQSNNMKHDDHCSNHASWMDFDEDYFLTETYSVTQKEFKYPDWSFKRFMKIGIK
jgi:hypothetical protein